jgi:hypothetical protein
MYGFIHDIISCKNCEFIYTWNITKCGITIKHKEYSCFLYQPYLGSVRDINKIPSFCKLSKDKNNYTSRESIKEYINLRK